MPRRLTRAQIEAEGGGMPVEEGPGPAPKPRRLTQAQIDAEGGGEAVADSPAGRHRATVPDELTEEGGLSHGPGTSFALNALDSLSMVGLPTTLGMKDALMGDAKDGDFRTRYRKAKEFYEGGMKRLGDSNPDSALAGQLAPIVVPGGAMAKGAKFGATVARGAATGALTGALRGPSKTLDGDLEGTAGDALLGGAAGGVLSGVGAVAGKVVEKGGDIARKGMGKVLAEVKKRTASDIGTARNLGGQAAGAVENLWNKRAMDDDAAKALVALARRRGPNARIPAKGVVPGLEARAPAQVARNLGRREGNANRALDVEQELFDKFGQNLRSPKHVLNARHLKEISKEGTGHLKGAAQAAALGFGGYKAAEAAGVDPRIGAAIGGAGGLYSVRKISQAAASHPATLKKLMALKPIGRWLSRQMAKGAGVPQNVSAIVYAHRNDPEVKRVLREYEASSRDQSEP